MGTFMHSIKCNATVQNAASFPCYNVLYDHHVDSDHNGWTPSQPCRHSAPAASNRARCSRLVDHLMSFYMKDISILYAAIITES